MEKMEWLLALWIWYLHDMNMPNIFACMQKKALSLYQNLEELSEADIAYDSRQDRGLIL